MRRFPTIVGRHRHRHFAEALAAMPFVADPHAQVRRTMNCVEVVDVDVADDLRVVFVRSMTRDASLPVSPYASFPPPAEGAVQGCAGNVVGPSDLSHRSRPARKPPRRGSRPEKHSAPS